MNHIIIIYHNMSDDMSSVWHHPVYDIIHISTELLLTLNNL